MSDPRPESEPEPERAAPPPYDPDENLIGYIEREQRPPARPAPSSRDDAPQEKPEKT
ncbi:MAG TPA: hypothetical protein VKV06_00050 [Acidimicrobiales bacterium]|nr:hypothetical protein [Acidimicrobiales bacterium]